MPRSVERQRYLIESHCGACGIFQGSRKTGWLASEPVPPERGWCSRCGKLTPRRTTVQAL